MDTELEEMSGVVSTQHCGHTSYYCIAHLAYFIVCISP